MKFLNYQQKEPIIFQTNFYLPFCTKLNTKKYVQAGTRVLLNTGAPVATALNQASKVNAPVAGRLRNFCFSFESNSLINQYKLIALFNIII